MAKFLITKTITTTTTIVVEAEDADAAEELANTDKYDDKWAFDEYEDWETEEISEEDAKTWMDKD